MRARAYATAEEFEDAGSLRQRFMKLVCCMLLWGEWADVTIAPGHNHFVLIAMYT